MTTTRTTFAALGLIGIWLTTPVPMQTPQDAPLLMQDDLVYAGAFRVPDGPDEAHTFAYGGTGLAFNPARASLLLVSHNWTQRVAELAIPDIRKDVSAQSGLATARLLQPFTDVLNGHRQDVGGGPSNIGGLLPVGNQLIVSVYVNYDATGSQTHSHFVTGTDFAHLPELRGPYQVGSAAGFVSGYMAPVPTEWQADLGGPYLTGQCCLSIISRTSYGPALSVFDPNDLGAAHPKVPVTPLLGYPGGHTTLGAWDSSNSLFNGATTMGGVIFPAGTRSVLFFGRLATTFCYGDGTADAAMNGKQDADGARLCFDPAGGAKGTHGYPYANEVWAYDALDLAAVRLGKKHPWDVKPYATWAFDLPFQQVARQIIGAAYDPATRRVFVVGGFEDGDRPLVHVFTLRTRP